MKILGIESSCDETAAAIVENGRKVISGVVASSVEEQALYGGIVPEIASRRHIESISRVVEKTFEQAAMKAADIDGIAVTYAPGLIGALLVGVNYAKGLALALDKPLIAVHHLRGHIASLYLSNKDLKPPFLCLVASGGHCHYVQVERYTSFKVLGRTVDDAAGEAFDKVARTLGLGYPGGPAIAKAALSGNPFGYTLPTPKVAGEYDVSFSGLKTAVLNIVNKANMKGEEINKRDLSASFQQKVADILSSKLVLAAENTGAQKICLSGGVAANSLLRETIEKSIEGRPFEFYKPKLKYCGDNGEMIAAQGFFEYENGFFAGSNLNAYASLPIEENRF